MHARPFTAGRALRLEVTSLRRPGHCVPNRDIHPAARWPRPTSPIQPTRAHLGQLPERVAGERNWRRHLAPAQEVGRAADSLAHSLWPSETPL